MTAALVALALTFGFTPTQAEVWAWLTERGREHEYYCAAVVIAAESSWRPDAIGDEGQSFGLAQRYSTVHGMPPQPWPIPDQMEWFTNYADERYGDWCAGLRFRWDNGWW